MALVHKVYKVAVITHHHSHTTILIIPCIASTALCGPVPTIHLQHEIILYHLFVTF